MPRASYGDRHTITVMQGEENHVVFDFTSRVVDFVVLTHADENDTPDSRAGKQRISSTCAVTIMFIIIMLCNLLTGSQCFDEHHWLLWL